MPSARETEVLIKAARLYYEEGRTQSEVAAELEVSRSNVSRILTQARQQNLVEIIIHDPFESPSRVVELERQLMDRFGLGEAHVLLRRGDDTIASVARAAAQMLRDRATSVGSIGISWGHTLQTVAAVLEPGRLNPAPRLLPLVGGLDALDTMRSGDSVLRVIAEKLGTNPEPFYAPALVESAAAYRAFLEQTVIRDAINAAAAVETAFVGIGSHGLYSSRRLVAGMHLTKDELATFLAADPTGDICGRFVSRDGAPLGLPTTERVVGVTFEQLRAMPEVVGVAAGEAKVEGVLAVLRSTVLNALVVDSGLAAAVLEHA